MKGRRALAGAVVLLLLAAGPTGALAPAVAGGSGSGGGRAGEPAPGASPDSLAAPSYALTHGDHKALMILVEFSDVSHNSANNRSKYDTWANANGSTDISLRTYFYENSGGAYTLNTTVVGWVNVSHNLSYYVSSLSKLVGDASLAANSQVDFSEFDEDGNGYVDNLIIVHAGSDQASSGDGNDIYSETGTGTATTVDGVTVRLSSIVAEDGSTGTPIGVMIHEFGHLAFDLPDLYDTDFNHAGIGEWGLMAFGGWGGGGGTNPNHMSAWTKYYLGWIDPVIPTYDVSSYTIYPSSDPALANPVKLETNNSNEYFLLEFRYRNTSARFDAYLPTSGLVIWHIDDNVISSNWGSNTVNNDASHKGVDIEERGTQDMDQSWYNTGSTNDVWVSNASGFTPTSTPNSNMYTNSGQDATGISVTNISGVLTAGGPHMTFSIRAGLGDYSITGQVQNGSLRTVAPGGTTNYTILFSTAATGGDTLNLSLEGDLSGPSVSLNRTSLTLPAGGTGAVTLQVTLPTVCGSSQPYAIMVRARSSLAPLESGAAATLTVCGLVHGLNVTGPTALEVLPGQVGSLNFTLTAAGSGPEDVTLTLGTNSSSLDVESVAGPLAVPANGSTAIQVNFSVTGSELEGNLLGATLHFTYGDPNATMDAWRNVTVTVGRLTALALDLPDPQPALLEADTPFEVNVSVTNDGNHLASVTVSASPPPGVSVTFDDASPDVGPFSSGVVVATVTASSSWPAGVPSNLTFQATTAGLASPASALFSFAVGEIFDLSATGPTSVSALPGTPLVVPLVLTDTGNVADNVTVAAAFDGAKVAVSVAAGPLALSPGVGTALDVTVTLDGSVMAGTQVPVLLNFTYGPPGTPRHLEFSFTVTAQEQGTVLVRVGQVPTGPLEPGRQYSFDVVVQNDGNAEASVDVEVTGLPWLQVTVSSSALSVPAFSNASCTVTLVSGLGAVAGTQGVLTVFANSSGANGSTFVTVTQGQSFDVDLSGPGAAAGDPGQTVTFNLVAANRGNGPDNATVEVGPLPAGWSAQATPEDLELGPRSPANRTTFSLAVTIPPGAAGDTSQAVVVTLHSQAAGVSAQLTVTVFVSPTSGMAVDGLATHASADPGSTANFQISVANLGNVEATYSVTLSGLPAGWTWSPAGGGEVSVGPGESAPIQLSVQVAGDATAGAVDLTATVSGPEGSQDVGLQVQVKATRGLGVSVESPSGPTRPGGVASLNVTIENRGNGPATVLLTGECPAGAVSFDQAQPEIPAFGRVTVEVRVAVGNGTADGNYTLSVSAALQGAAAVTDSGQVTLEVQSAGTDPGNHPGNDPGTDPGTDAGTGGGSGGGGGLELVLVAVLAAGALAAVVVLRTRRGRA